MTEKPFKIAAIFLPVAIICVLGAIGFTALYSGPRKATSLMGPCSGSDQLASRDTYQRLALRLISDQLYSGSAMGGGATPEKVKSQLSRIAILRATYVPSLSDACLSAHVSDWLDYYEREARGAMARKAELGGFSDEYEKKQAQEEDQMRALKSAINAKPAQLEFPYVR